MQVNANDTCARAGNYEHTVERRRQGPNSICYDLLRIVVVRHVVQQIQKKSKYWSTSLKMSSGDARDRSGLINPRLPLQTEASLPGVLIYRTTSKEL